MLGLVCDEILKLSLSINYLVFLAWLMQITLYYAVKFSFFLLRVDAVHIVFTELKPDRFLKGLPAEVIHKFVFYLNFVKNNLVLNYLPPREPNCGEHSGYIPLLSFRAKRICSAFLSLNFHKQGASEPLPPLTFVGLPPPLTYQHIKVNNFIF